jgi:hypothetical protein
MLISTMNHSEISREVKRDYNVLLNTTILRLGSEYDRERRKLKIDNKRTYTRLYTIKTAHKNNWIIVMGKAPSKEKYIGTESLTLCCVTYFYDNKGLKVLNWTNIGVLQVYNGHFFQRYNQRLNLGLTSLIEIVKRYFFYNRYSCETCHVENDHIRFVGFSKDGLLLGELQQEGNWLVWRTFISRDLIRFLQQKKEKNRRADLLAYIQKAVRNQQTNSQSYWINLDKWEALSGGYNVE